MGDTATESCEIEVGALSGDKEYTFVLGGISPKIGKQTTVTGVFETPVIGEGNAAPVADEDESEETKETEQTAPSSTAPSESTTGSQKTDKAGAGETRATEGQTAAGSSS